MTPNLLFFTAKYLFTQQQNHHENASLKLMLQTEMTQINKTAIKICWITRSFIIASELNIIF